MQTMEQACLVFNLCRIQRLHVLLLNRGKQTHEEKSNLRTSGAGVVGDRRRDNNEWRRTVNGLAHTSSVPK